MERDYCKFYKISCAYTTARCIIYGMKNINIVLMNPEIPQNTGNIARTCAAVGAALHLIHPLGFSIDDRKLKRAGLDYWHSLDIMHYASPDDFFENNTGGEFYYFSTKAKRIYTDVKYPEPVFLFFGRETKGLDETLLHDNYDRTVRLPMLNGQRSLNLSNSVAVAVYEVLRQRNFEGLRFFGELTQF